MTAEEHSPLDPEISRRLVATRQWARVGKAALYRGQRRSRELTMRLRIRRLGMVVKRIPVLGVLITGAVRALRKLRNALRRAIK